MTKVMYLAIGLCALGFTLSIFGFVATLIAKACG